jgi:hypothetical protein
MHYARHVIVAGVTSLGALQIFGFPRSAGGFPSSWLRLGVAFACRDDNDAISRVVERRRYSNLIVYRHFLCSLQNTLFFFA